MSGIQNGPFNQCYLFTSEVTMKIAVCFLAYCLTMAAIFATPMEPKEEIKKRFSWECRSKYTKKLITACMRVNLK